MALAVCGGALIQCTFGMAPSTLNVLPQEKVVNIMPIATVMDNKPLVNVMPFGMCQSMMNPTVAAATAAAMGALTPMPCVPVLTAPWTPGSSTCMIGGKPALNQSCQLMCAYGGSISVTNPGQTTIQVP